MSRLFITSREIDLISDLTKELVKDVVGQKVYYYAVREDLTQIHDVYEEAINKVFDPPIEIDARVDYQAGVIKTNRFGNEEMDNINVFFHERDLIDKEIDVKIGDFFSYGEVFFEITSTVVESTVYGQIEHSIGIKAVGKQARIGQIDFAPLGPTSAALEEPGAVQENFVQQRGLAENSEGPTNDTRALQDKGKLEPPAEGPAEVKNSKGTSSTESFFYGDK